MRKPADRCISLPHASNWRPRRHFGTFLGLFQQYRPNSDMRPEKMMQRSSVSRFAKRTSMESRRLFATKTTPKPVLEKLAGALDKRWMMQTPASACRNGSDIPDKASRVPQPLAPLIKSEIAKWTP